MSNKKMIALVAAAALAACLALAGCGGTQAASSSAAASSGAAASASAASESASAASESASASAATESASASASAAAASASAAPASSAASAEVYLPVENALDIALADAGLSQNAVTDLKAELDLDDAVVHYDVEFKANGLEYDYDIDATTGAIIQAKSEVDD